MTTADPQPFAGFPAEALTFLAQLRFYNSADWFKPRKATYDRVLVEPMVALLSELSQSLRAQGLPLIFDPKTGLFRVQRDVRFTKDKQPYKTHAAGVLSRNGRKGDPGMVYVHVEPTRSFAALGFWMPEPDLAKAWRNDMMEKPDRFLKVVKALAKSGLTLSTEDAYKRLPRDFDSAKGTAIEAHIKQRHLIVEMAIDDMAVQSPDLVRRIAEFVVKSRPLLSYGWLLTDR